MSKIYTLNQAELNELRDMRANTQAGEYWKIYAHLKDLLVEKYNAPADNQTVLWLAGATEANAGRGMYSAMITA